MTTRPNLDDLDRLAEGATPGPWKQRDDRHYAHLILGRGPDTPTGGLGHQVIAETGAVGWRANAEFIAAARTAVPALTAALRAVLAAHRPVEVEPSGTICAGCSTLHRTGSLDVYYEPAGDWPCPTVWAIAEHVEVDCG